MLATTHVDRTEITEVPFEFNIEPFLSQRIDVWPIATCLSGNDRTA